MRSVNRRSGERIYSGGRLRIERIGIFEVADAKSIRIPFPTTLNSHMFRRNKRGAFLTKASKA